MAIRTLSFMSLILRPYVKQTISTDGWKCLLGYANPYHNFDGEIMAFGAMSGRDIEAVAEELMSYGYIGPDEGDLSDMVLSSSIFGQSNIPSWLELVDVTFFDEGLPPVKAWKMKNSNVYDLIDFEADLSQPRKGYQCDWPPLIGRIGG